MGIEKVIGRYDLAGLLLTSFNEKGVEIINDAIETHCKFCKDKKSDNNVCFELYITKYLMKRVLNDLKNSTVLNPPLQQSDFVSTNDTFISQVVRDDLRTQKGRKLNKIYSLIEEHCNTRQGNSVVCPTFTNAIKSLHANLSTVVSRKKDDGKSRADVAFYNSQNQSYDNLVFITELKVITGNDANGVTFNTLKNNLQKAKNQIRTSRTREEDPNKIENQSIPARIFIQAKGIREQSVASKMLHDALHDGLKPLNYKNTSIVIASEYSQDGNNGVLVQGQLTNQEGNQFNF